ncbi:SDR family oxidoreductase [Microbacterium sp. 4R-513]|uniref:SDR family NAD(P)-dependent oxidoreductase n=1 Tax=Microbacterium sp. 4R-513 TaxID=2567934 RepID=UPI0013E20525|nr:SDR family oxidoreductase [Microbacterium sp. 4R-513]QIG38630.1 SDR family oxidoreductase [Microbacterium sp. 4R-513]
MTTSLAGRTILLSGGTSAVGEAAARTALDRGATVVVAGHDPAKLDRMAEALPGVRGAACDLTDEAAVRGLADELHADVGRIDGVLHLVGGWRGGGGLAGQTDDDFRFLERSLTALRHVTRAFDDDLRSSPAGRLAIVSSTAVARPLAGGANYAAVKAASEAWTRAVAQGFAKAARDASQPLAAASVVFRVKALDGLEQTLADAFTGLWAADAADVNDTVVTLG